MNEAETMSERRPRRGADLAGLQELYQWSLTERSLEFEERLRKNLDTRYARWTGQSPDERRWGKNYGRVQIFPWDGASDIRLRLVDRYVREDVAFLMVLWSRMKTVVTPVELGDVEKGSRLTQVLRWMKYTQMPEIRREARLLANYLLERGAAVMGVFWLRREQLARQKVRLEELAVLAQQGLIPGEFPALVVDPEREDAAIEVGRALLPESVRERLSRSELRDMVRSLRLNGEASYPVPEVVADRPTVTAFSLYDEIILPPDFNDFETTRAVFWRELVTETTLRERVETMGWNPRWVEAVVERGRGVISDERRWTGEFVRQSGWTDRSRLFEVVHAYRRLHDEQGVPGLWYTCFSPVVISRVAGGEEDFVAHHDLLDYAHGRYPFVLFEREVLSRSPFDSRGYGEVGYGVQRHLKEQWDLRLDRTKLATLPPRFAPPGRRLDLLGPGVEFETRQPDAYGFVAIPRYDVGSKEIEETIREFSDAYFGRLVKNQDPTRAELLQQELAEVWLQGWSEVDTMLLQLMQQYMPDEFYYRLVGTLNTRPLRATRQEIQGRFDVSLSYDTANFNRQYAAEKMDLVTKMLSLDTLGLVDREQLLQLLAELIEPNAAERLIRPAQAAAQVEIEDERAVFAQLMSGVQVDVKPGQNYPLRHQVLTALLQQNPTAQEKLRGDPHVQTVVMNRLKQLEQQIQQAQNRLIGVYGAMPSQQGPSLPLMTGRPGGGE